MVLFPESTTSEEVYLGYTREALDAAWELIAPAGHWKDPIDKLVDARENFAPIVHSIGFYTGTMAKVGPADEVEPGMRRVTAPGYWAGPAN